MAGTDGQAKAFLISQIGEPLSAERRRADEVYEHTVTPVAQDFGLSVLRADFDLTPGQITAQMIRSLLNSKVVFADLTGQNPNVYYELGVAHSFRLPIAILIDKSASLSFDMQGERAVAVGDDGTISLSQAAEARRQLRSVLEIILEDGYEPQNLLTSVAASQSLEALVPSDPVAYELAALRELIESTNTMLRGVIRPRSTQKDPEALIFRSFVEDLLSREMIRLDDIERLSHAKNMTLGMSHWIEALRQDYFLRMQQRVFDD
jgi:hypothetical protein